MDIRILIGMPLWYAKSVLQRENISYTITETVSRSHFFPCDDQQLYVIRVREEDDGRVTLLINRSLVMTESVSQAIQGREGT